MTQHVSASSGPDHPPAAPDRRWFRRWWVIGGLLVALLLAGAAAVYAGTTLVDGGSPGAGDLAEPTAAPATSAPPIPPGLLPSGAAEAGFSCMQVFGILADMIDVDVDFVETRRAAADRLRELEAPSPLHRAALDDLASELDAAAQLVEDDPAAEPEASDRERAASDAFIDSGACD